jgi:N6-L-threonylcarbamoyladenine synthase
MNNILGIETSCDETAAAVVSGGNVVRSSVVASQTAVHHPYGGVVPELASRKHLEAVSQVVSEAIDRSGLQLNRIDAVAVTQGPGLIGALLVGFSFAKAYAYALDIPCVGVNHLEGHIHSVFLEADSPDFPFVALLVSGGHTGIYHVTSHTGCELMGQTRDDAAGEAFDKVAKMLGLGYPGGVAIEAVSRTGDPLRIQFPRPYLDKADSDFSFSGLKSAVRRYVETHDFNGNTPDIVAGFQEAVADVLTFKLTQAALSRQCRRIAVVGGVAANSRLREKVKASAAEKGLSVFIPSPAFCGDNAAMIAAAGYHKLRAGHFCGLTDDVYSKVMTLQHP